MEKKTISLMSKAHILIDEFKEYISFLESRVENQHKLILSLQENLEAYACFVRGLRVVHKGTPNFQADDDDIEVINID